MREISQIQRILRVTAVNVMSTNATANPDFNEKLWNNLTKCVSTSHVEFTENLEHFVFKTVNHTMKELIRCLHLLDEFIRNNHRI